METEMAIADRPESSQMMYRLSYPRLYPRESKLFEVLQLENGYRTTPTQQ